MDSVILLIRSGVALTMILFGLNQFFYPNQWFGYLPNWIDKISPFSKSTDMRLHSLGNIVFGTWLAIGIFPIAATWVNIVWWVSILPFAFMKDWRIGLRDLSITASLVALLIIYKIT